MMLPRDYLKHLLILETVCRACSVRDLGLKSFVIFFVLFIQSPDIHARSSVLTDQTLPLILTTDDGDRLLVYPKFSEGQLNVSPRRASNLSAKKQKIISLLDFHGNLRIQKPDLSKSPLFLALDPLERANAYFVGLSSQKPSMYDIRAVMSLPHHTRNAEFFYNFSVACNVSKLNFNADICHEYRVLGITLGSKARVFYE